MAKDTRQRIIDQATILFQEKGYNEVGVREIAKAANCSHTTLYIYFKTKEAILFEVAKKPLQELGEQLKMIDQEDISVSKKIVEMCHTYIVFGFEYQNAYHLLFISGAERVDTQTFNNPLSEIRLASFNLLKANIDVHFANVPDDEVRLNIARGIFLFLHGFIHLYSQGSGAYNERLKKIVDDYLYIAILNE